MSYLPIGLDIGSHTIKLVQLVKKNKKNQLQALGQTATPRRGLISDAQVDNEALAIVIKKLFSDCKATERRVNASISESQIFTRILQMPPLTEKEVASAIRWEAEQYIPLPLEEVKIDFSILKVPQNGENEKMEVLLVAAPISLVEKYRVILEMAGLEPVSLEPEILAVSRSFMEQSDAPTLIINLGAKNTDFCIVREKIPVFTRSISTGGEALARAVARDLGFDLSQAEEYKRVYGLGENKFEGKILTAIRPILEMIIQEIKKSIIFYQEKYKGEALKIISLCGGTAKLPGLVVYLAENLGIETQIGNPWVNIIRDEKVFPNIEEDGPVYAVAVGLALKEMS